MALRSGERRRKEFQLEEDAVPNDRTAGDPVRRVRSTKSPQVKQCDPVTIHDSPGKVVKYRARSVTHNSGVITYEARITRYDPRKPEVTDFALELEEPDLQRLAAAIAEYGPIVRAGEHGTFVLIRLGDVDALDGASTEGVRTLLTSLARNDGLRRIIEEIAGAGALEELVSDGRRVARLRSAISELEGLLSSPQPESAMQEWAARNSWCFGLQYAPFDDERRLSMADKADLLLPRLIDGCRDLVELKRADVEVLKIIKNDVFAFTEPVTSAIAQAVHYLDILREDAGPQGRIRGARRIRAFHPDAIIVIGLSKGWDERRRQAWVRLNAHLHGVHVFSYDELLDRGRMILELLTRSRPG
jgi:hypothetical protein